MLPSPRVLLIAAALAGCGRDEAPDSLVAGAAPAADRLDVLALRIPLAGGVARVMPYPALDTVLWTATARLPAPGRILAFSAEAGSLVGITKTGLPMRLDLHLGEAATSGRAALRSPGSADGATMYGLDAKGLVVRVTAAGTWSHRPRRPVREIHPLPGGALLLAADDRDRTHLWTIRPPDTTVADSGSVPRARRLQPSPVGDRLIVAGERTLLSVRTSDLETTPAIRLDETVRAVVPTPSGDRLYVVEDSAAALIVVDRYRNKVAERIVLPGIAADARMDPWGRYVLVRPATGDSAWVVAVGSGRVLGTVASQWRADLPAVAVDGTVLSAQGPDVVLLEPETLRRVKRVAGGAKDLWFLFEWNGFRPRAAGLDEPVQFAFDSLADTAGLSADSIAAAFGAPDSAAAPPPPGAGAAPPSTRGYYASFAALLQEDAARLAAREIRDGDGRSAHVVSSMVQGAVVYRVVLGPYGSREAADRAGRAAGRQYWVYEAEP